MIKLGKLTDYAIAVMGQLAHATADASSSARALSDKTGVPEPTVAKVLKLLAKGDLVTSERGTNGGYRLAKLAAEISIGEIITAMEGPVAIVACIEGQEESCNMFGTCPTKSNWHRVNAAIKSALDGIKLTEMMTAPAPKNYLVKDIHVHRA